MRSTLKTKDVFLVGFRLIEERMGKYLTLLALVLVCASPAFASTMAIDFASPGIVYGPSVWSAGFSFRANTAAKVARLGVFDAAQPGLAGIQQVGLWNSSGQLLASTLVDDNDALEGYFRFHSIPSVVLTVGETYYVASQGGEAFTFQTNGFTVNPNITFLQDSWNFNFHSNYFPLAYPGNSYGITASLGGGLFGANLDFATPSTAVPEPTSLILLGAGLVGLLARYSKGRN